MADDDRSDAAVAQAMARAQQPKVIAEGPASRQSSLAPPSISLNIVFDNPSFSGSSSSTDQIDASRFIYMGVSQNPSDMQLGRQRRTEMSSMGEFKW
jgi:hypothetical protein